MTQQTDQVAPDTSVAPVQTEGEAVAQLDELRLRVAAAKSLRTQVLSPPAEAGMSPERQAELAAETARLQAELDETLDTVAKESGASLDDIKAVMLQQVQAQQDANTAQAEALANAEPVDPATPVEAPVDPAVVTETPDANSVTPPPGGVTPPSPSVPEVPAPDAGSSPDPSAAPEGEVGSTDPTDPTTKTTGKGGSR